MTHIIHVDAGHSTISCMQIIIYINYRLQTHVSSSSYVSHWEAEKQIIGHFYMDD